MILGGLFRARSKYLRERELEGFMVEFQPPSPPYEGPVKWHGDKSNQPIDRVVIHGTVTPCVPGQAARVVSYFKTTARPSSAHYVVDPVTVLQAVYDGTVAYHAPPNTHSIGVELCDPVEGPLSRWNDVAHRRLLRKAAVLVAQLCLAYDVPIRKIGRVGLLAGRKGICGHADVSAAWHQTDHWDPGAFPWRRFIRMVKAEADTIRAASQPIVPIPRRTRVTKARAILQDAIDVLAAVPKRRKRVHTLRDHLIDDLNNMPEA